jgi:acetyl esterase/lipase
MAADLSTRSCAHLGLAAAQWLRDSGYRQPNGLVLISPAVDAAVDRAEHRVIAASDPVQDIPGIVEAARLYAGGLDISHPYVSPLQGDLRGLAPMIIFSGTLDLVYVCPDSIELAAKVRAAGVSVELYLRQGQPHNNAAIPTPEGACRHRAHSRQRSDVIVARPPAFLGMAGGGGLDPPSGPGCLSTLATRIEKYGMYVTLADPGSSSFQ